MQRQKAARSQPQHALIAAVLMSRIASGAYHVGGLLPTEYRLSEEFQKSRQTIREALRHLTARKLVERQPGVGTRVVQQSPQPHFSYSISSLSELAEYALEARLAISSIDKASATAEQAVLLECSEGDSWHDIRGVRFRQADGMPFGVTHIYLRDWYPGVQEHLLNLEGATHVMLAREYGVEIEKIRQDARATLLTKNEAKLLDASEGGPGMGGPALLPGRRQPDPLGSHRLPSRPVQHRHAVQAFIAGLVLASDLRDGAVTARRATGL